MAALGLCCCTQAFSSCGKWGHSSSRCTGLSLSRPLLLRSTGSRHSGSVIAAHGPSCSAACGIFPDQGTNPCPLHWQADSQPLHHQGSPCPYSFVFVFSFFFCPTQVLGEALAFWEVWGLLPVFSRCSVGVVPRVDIFLMYLWGGRWSPRLIPPPSWRSPQVNLLLNWNPHPAALVRTWTFFSLRDFPSLPRLLY